MGLISVPFLYLVFVLRMFASEELTLKYALLLLVVKNIEPDH